MNACKLSTLMKTLNRYFNGDHVSPVEFEQMVFDVNVVANDGDIDKIAEIEILVRKLFLADNTSITAPASNPLWRKAYLDVQKMTKYNERTSVFDPTWLKLEDADV